MTKYLFIGIAVLTLALGIVTRLYLWKVEEFGALEVQYEHQRQETVKAIALYDDALAQHKMQLDNYHMLNIERQNDEIQYKKELARIRGLLESTMAAALKEPKRFGRIATYNFRRSLRNVCRSGGGSADDCKIAIPKPTTPNTSDSVQPDNQDDDRMAEQG